ncbi:MAG: dihydropteroate synthase [Alphaproteobacteria bacterium]
MSGATLEDTAAFLNEAASREVYVRPVGLLAGADAGRGIEAGTALALAGGPLSFPLCEIIVRTPQGRRCRLVSSVLLRGLAQGGASRAGPQGSRIADLLEKLSAPRPAFAGLPLPDGRAEHALVMGVLNTTPDSFSDGARFRDAETAIAHGIAMAKAGADIIDVGGESTRPGATPVPVQEEMNRVLPVVRTLASRGLTVSIDTRKAEVMGAALQAGAKIVNDVSALGGDPDSLRVVAARGASAVLMHMQGEPETMQSDPRYDDAALDVFDFLEQRVGACGAAGVAPGRLLIDPGIGFGKTKRHNAEILASLALYHGLGCGLLIGVSRKGFVAGARGSAPPEERLPGSLSAALLAVSQGVQVVRVHDVAETRQALDVWDAVHARA